MLDEFKIFNGSLDEINLDNLVINTINPHSYCVSKIDPLFFTSLKQSDILLPDGIGIVLAEKFLNGNSIKKIAGYDLFIFLMKKINKNKGSVFFLGSTVNTLKKIKANCKKDFPNIKIETFSPPFKKTFSMNDSKIMCDKVNSFQPDILFVGMTAPKQEKWVHIFKENLNAKVICSVGAVFDFYSGNIHRSSEFWIRLNMEWLPRLIKEPRRLFYRNFVSTPKFIIEVIFFKLFGKGIL